MSDCIYQKNCFKKRLISYSIHLSCCNYVKNTLSSCLRQSAKLFLGQSWMPLCHYYCFIKILITNVTITKNIIISLKPNRNCCRFPSSYICKPLMNHILLPSDRLLYCDILNLFESINHNKTHWIWSDIHSIYTSKTLLIKTILCSISIDWLYYIYHQWTADCLLSD